MPCVNPSLLPPVMGILEAAGNKIAAVLSYLINSALLEKQGQTHNILLQSLTHGHTSVDD